MQTLEKLYSLDKKQKIREYQCGYESQPDGTWIITTAAGLLDGKKTINHTIVRTGKQSRTVEEQVELQAKSKWKGKLDEGYKSYSTHRNSLIARHPKTEELFHINPDLDEEKILIEKLFIELGITWNTSSLWTPLPMLAEPIKKVRNPTFPYIAQRKLNGVRCIAKLSEPGNTHSHIQLCSRGGQLYTSLDNIENDLRKIFTKYPMIMLDGEVYVHGLNLNQISGRVRRESAELFGDPVSLEYHIYDVPVIGGDAYRMQHERELNREALRNEFNDLEYVKFIDSDVVNSLSATEELHDQFVEEGYEGLILRDPSAKYMFSFRDKCLIKFKNFFDDEYEVVNVYCKQPGDISTIVFHLKDKSGTPFKSRPKGNANLWSKYLKNPPYGKMATVRYIALSDVNKVPSHSNVLVMRDYE